MKRLVEAPRVSLGLLLVVLVGSACGRDTAEDRDTTVVGTLVECDPPTVVSPDTRTTIVAWARGLAFHPQDSSRGYVTGAPTPGSTRIVQATGDARRRSRAVLGRGCIIGRIISSQADTALGLAADTNYVWADSTTSGWQVVTLSGTSTVVRSFRMIIHAHGTAPSVTASAVLPPRPCIDCEIAGWCRWPRLDSLDVAVAVPRGARLGVPGGD